MNTAWMENPVFQKMEPFKKQIILDLVKESGGRSLNDSLPLLLKAQNRLKANKTSFTPEETAALIAALTMDMSPADKAKVEAMKNFLHH